MKGFIMKITAWLSRIIFGPPVEEKLKDVKAESERSRQAVDAALEEVTAARAELHTKASKLKAAASNGLKDRTTQVLRNIEARNQERTA